MHTAFTYKHACTHSMHAHARTRIHIHTQGGTNTISRESFLYEKFVELIGVGNHYSSLVSISILVIYNNHKYIYIYIYIYISTHWCAHAYKQTPTFLMPTPHINALTHMCTHTHTEVHKRYSILIRYAMH